MIEGIKKKFELLVYFFKRRNLPESLGLVSVILAGILILVIIIAIFEFVLPRTSLEIKISGPKEAKAGELITYKVACKNTGNVVIKNPELVFNYPSHSIPEKGELIEKVGPEQFKGSIIPKETEIFYFKTRLFGTKGEKEEVKFWLNYYTKHKKNLQMTEVHTFSTQVSEVPLDLELDVPSKIPISPETETEFKFRVRYASFIPFSLSNLKLKIDYPPDFVLKESKPRAEKENQWEIKKLGKGETGAIEVWGNFPRGQKIGKEITFNAKLFLLSGGEKILIKGAEKKSLTSKRVLLISQKINGKSEYFPYPGERLHYQVYFKNIQEKPLRDLTLISVLESNLYDLFTIDCPRGEFKLGDNSITWNGEKIPELGYLQPGEEGMVEFWVRLKPDYKPRDIFETNALIKDRISLAGFEKEFRTKVNTKLVMVQEGYFRDKYGFFENFGSHPPKVNQTTSYTIVWKIENYYNLVKNAKIKASFPPQVKVKSTGPTPHGEISLKGKYVERAVYPGIPANFKFEHNLSYRMTSEEVKYLQIILKKEVPQVYPASTGATGYFGGITFNSVIAFQNKYKKEILKPQGLKEGTGYVDELTRQKLNELLSRGVSIAANEIVWKIDKIEAGVGVFSKPWVAAFQITFTPTLSQKGKIAELISKVIFTAEDQWTGEMVSASDELINTILPDDPTVREWKKEKEGIIR